MRKAFIVCQKHLTNTHYTSLALEDARTAVKVPVTMLMAWKVWADLPDQDQKAEDLIAWLKDKGKEKDYLVLHGHPDAVNRLRQAGLDMGLIPLEPAWDPDLLTETESGHVLPQA